MYGGHCIAHWFTHFTARYHFHCFAAHRFVALFLMAERESLIIMEHRGSVSANAMAISSTWFADDAQTLQA